MQAHLKAYRASSACPLFNPRPFTLSFTSPPVSKRRYIVHEERATLSNIVDEARLRTQSNTKMGLVARGPHSRTPTSVPKRSSREITINSRHNDHSVAPRGRALSSLRPESSKCDTAFGIQPGTGVRRSLNRTSYFADPSENRPRD